MNGKSIPVRSHPAYRLVSAFERVYLDMGVSAVARACCKPTSTIDHRRGDATAYRFIEGLDIARSALEEGRADLAEEVITYLYGDVVGCSDPVRVTRSSCGKLGKFISMSMDALEDDHLDPAERVRLVDAAQALIADLQGLVTSIKDAEARP